MKQHTLFWGSSYDRGLDILLFMWPDIREKYPDAKLHITYGWDLFDALRGGNPERLQWKLNVQKMMNQPGIVHWGRVGKEQLKSIRQECGVWAYPTYFPEINCITALECQSDGVVPVTMDDFALSETVGSGIKVKGDINKLAVQDEFKKQLIELMGDNLRWRQESEKAVKFAKSYGWEKQAKKWVKLFTEPVSEPLVSVITVTIRPGFWNVMASNLSKQSYKNFEWLIIDDYKEDRSKIAEKYAKKYNLNIRYIRGDKGKNNRRYALVRANNKAWKEAKGELLVFVQDFILIPSNGVEMLVDLYRHHPNALLAPVDERWNVKTPNLENTEDWWDGNTDVLTQFDWRNVRVQFQGIRESQNPFDFEMNYGAIPKSILDELNGWYEYFDNGLGYDNTDIASRALQRGKKIIIDDRNECIAVNLWPIIGGKPENITERDRNLGLPYWIWMKVKMEKGDFPIVRDEAFDASIRYSFKVPDEIPDDQCAKYITDHTEEIIKEWK